MILRYQEQHGWLSFILWTSSVSTGVLSTEMKVYSHWAIIMDSVDYKDRYIFSFFNYYKFELVLAEEAISFKRDKGILWKTVFWVLTYAEPGYWNRSRLHWRAFTGGKQWWNISFYEISLEQKCISAWAKVIKNNKLIKNNHMRKIIRFMKHVAISGLST